MRQWEIKNGKHVDVAAGTRDIIEGRCAGRGSHKPTWSFHQIGNSEAMMKGLKKEGWEVGENRAPRKKKKTREKVGI